MRAALSLALLLAAFAAPFVLRWARARRWGLPVSVAVDPDDPQPADICGYFAEIARRLDARPERMRVAFDGRTREGRALALDLDPDGALRVSVDGRRPRRVDLRGRWIADHPVPLSLKRARLYIEPVDANRFRVMSSIPFVPPPVFYVFCSLVATVGVVVLVPELVVLPLGLAVGASRAAASGCLAQQVLWIHSPSAVRAAILPRWKRRRPRSIRRNLPMR